MSGPANAPRSDRLRRVSTVVAVIVLSLTYAAGAASTPRHRPAVRATVHRHGYLAVRRPVERLRARPGTRRADLKLASAATSSAGAAPGRSFPIVVGVRRVGHSPRTRLQAVVTAYLSRTSKLPAKRRVSGGSARVTVPKSGKAKPLRIAFVVPVGTAPGRYFVVACVAILGHYRDAKAADNCRPIRRPITVTGKQPGGSTGGGTPSSGGSTGGAPTGGAPTPGGGTTGTAPPPNTPVPVAVTPPAPGPSDPPAPSAAAVASQLKSSEATSFRDSIKFLFTGDNPVQQGVSDPSVITEAGAALLHGLVTDTQGTAIGGVRVAILGHPEYGHTDTASDGSFAMAVNGADTLTVTYTRAGYIPVQNSVDVLANQAARTAATALLAYQGQANDIDLSSTAPMQVATGSLSSDASGNRQAMLLFSAGTHATEHLAGGGTKNLTDLHVRATEFTVGAYGPAAMPGTLPPTSAYTYAAAFTIDEAVADGAESVTFDKTVVSYVDNFLGFPTGAAVPSGSYDPGTGQWEAAPNGIVVKVLSTSGGTATLDVDGSGQPASADQLSALGITTAELQAIATNYQAGASLWRMPLTHFSSWDFNFLPDKDRPDPPPPPFPDNPPEDLTCHAPGGSTILCDSRAIAEDVRVAGTPYVLHYQSDRVAGYAASDAITVPATSANGVPDSVDHIGVDIDILGHLYHHEYCLPGGTGCAAGAEQVASGNTANLAYDIVWDGRDGFGRAVTGGATASVTVTYWMATTYDCQIYTSGGGGGTYNPSAFGSPYDGADSCGAPARELTPVADTEQVDIGPAANVGTAGLGDWDLNVHDSYDPVTGVLHRGDGSDESVQAVAPVLNIVAGGGSGLGDGGPATDAELEFPDGLLELSDGSMLIADCGANRVRKVAANGTITTYAGNGTAGNTGDGGPATSAELNCPSSLAQGPDGVVYVADELGAEAHNYGGDVRRIARNGTISTIAGGGDTDPRTAVGKPATDVTLDYPGQIAAGGDGSLYIADRANGIVDRVDPAGTFSIVNYDPDTDSTKGVDSPSGIAVEPNGDILVSDEAASQVLRLGPGTSAVVAGDGTEGDKGDQGPAKQAELEGPGTLAVAPNGDIYVGETSGRVRLIAATGKITTVAGGGTSFPSDGSTPATAALLEYIGGLAVDATGALLIGDGAGYVYRMHTTLTGLGNGNILIPTDDGTRVDVFDGGGREEAVYDATTDVKLLSFDYDSAGRLSDIADQYGRKTTITRNGTGAPTAIVGPDGQSTGLTVDSGGRLATITDPVGDVTQAAYNAAGQLNAFTDPAGHASSMTYDAIGRLVSDTDQAGATTTLSSGIDASGANVVTAHLPGGRTATYSDSNLGYGYTIHKETDPAGGVTELDSFGDGLADLTLPDGTERFTFSTGDPRFGMAAPVPTTTEVTTPDGNGNISLTATRTVHLSDPDDPLSVSSLTTTSSIDGGPPSSATYTAANRRITRTSAGGRVSTITLDNHDDVVATTTPQATAGTTYTRDASTGRLTKVEQGSHSETFTYDAGGNLASTKNAAGEEYQYSADDAGRLTTITRPGGQTYAFGYDPDGAVDAVITPGGAVHQLGHTAVGLLSSYVAPTAAAGTSMQYNAARQMNLLTLPGGRTVGRTFDSGGRVSGSTADEGDVHVTYDGHTTNVATLQRTFASGPGETLTATHDGGVLTGLTLAGLANGSYAYQYSDGRLTDLDLTIGSDSYDTPQAFDDDGLLTTAGAFTLTRDSSTGLVTGIDDGTMSESITHDAFGGEATRDVSVNGAAAYKEELAHDSSGRLTSRKETIGGTTHTLAYVYDSDGRLKTVTRDGAASEAYAYDDDGNLTSRQSGGGAAQTLLYDSQGRETQLGSTVYGYDADGRLHTRGGDTFTYGTRAGELDSASIGGTTVTYGYDGVGRRVSRTQGANTEQYLYGDPTKPNRLTASVAPGGTVTVYSYDHAGRLIGFQRGSSTYYVATDAIGSPRVVTDASGTIVKQVVYDAYGEVLGDSAPSFALDVGYAGGVADSLTGLVRFGARDYDPASGRFTERDPSLFNGGANLYAYAGDDPIDFTDPTGLEYESANDPALTSLPAQWASETPDPPPPPSAWQRFTNWLGHERDSLADKAGEAEMACSNFIHSDNPRSAIPAIKQLADWAFGKGPVDLGQGAAADQVIDQAVPLFEASGSHQGDTGGGHQSMDTSGNVYGGGS